jgi:uncharacterized membrane protein
MTVCPICLDEILPSYDEPPKKEKEKEKKREEQDARPYTPLLLKKGGCPEHAHSFHPECIAKWHGPCPLCRYVECGGKGNEDEDDDEDVEEGGTRYTTTATASTGIARSTRPARSARSVASERDVRGHAGVAAHGTISLVLALLTGFVMLSEVDLAKSMSAVFVPCFAILIVAWVTFLGHLMQYRTPLTQWGCGLVVYLVCLPFSVSGLFACVLLRAFVDVTAVVFVLVLGTMQWFGVFLVVCL